MRPYRWIFIACSSLAALPLMTQGKENLSCSVPSPTQIYFDSLLQLLGKCQEASKQENDLLFFEAYRSFRNTLYENSFVFNSYLKNSDMQPDFADHLAQCILYAIYYEQFFQNKFQDKGIAPTSSSYHTIPPNKANSNQSNTHFIVLFDIIKAYVKVIKHQSSPQSLAKTNTDKIIDAIIAELNKNQGAETDGGSIHRQAIKSILEKFNVRQNYQTIFQSAQSSYETQSIDPSFNRSSSLISKSMHGSNAKQSPRTNEPLPPMTEDHFIVSDYPILNYKKSSLLASNRSSAIDAPSAPVSSIAQPAESNESLNKDITNLPPEAQAPQNESQRIHSPQKTSFTNEAIQTKKTNLASSNIQESMDYVSEESFVNDFYECFFNQQPKSIEKYKNIPIDSILLKLRTIKSRDSVLNQKEEKICEKLEQLLIQTNIKEEKTDPLYLRDLMVLNTNLN